MYHLWYNPYMEFRGDILKSKRERQFLTQAELCRRSGVSRAMLSAWENGRRQPRISSIEKLQRVFGVEVWGWFYKEGLEEPPDV